MYVSNNRQREITTSNTDSINVDYISDIDYCYYTNIKFYDAQQIDVKEVGCKRKLRTIHRPGINYGLTRM